MTRKRVSEMTDDEIRAMAGAGPTHTTLTPLQSDAVRALDAFGVRRQRDARVLLSMWTRRDELSDADVTTVLDRYAAQREETR